VILSSGQSVANAGSLAIVNMTAIAAGNSDLTITNAIAGSVDAHSLPVTITNSQIITNHQPIFNNPGNRTVNEEALLSFTLSALDADGDPLTFSASNLPSGASFNAATRAFSWRPSASQVGVYSDILFSVTDNYFTIDQKISITVLNVNQSPVLGTISNQSVGEGSLLNFTVNGSDPDGDTLTYSASNLPAGSTFNTATHTFSWTPTYVQAGDYSNVRF